MDNKSNFSYIKTHQKGEVKMEKSKFIRKDLKKELKNTTHKMVLEWQNIQFRIMMELENIKMVVIFMVLEYLKIKKI